MIHTHPSSGRVDRVRSFHSAQKASLRSWFSSDTRQLSSEVAMILSCSLCYALLLQSPLNRPLLPPLPFLQGLFSAPLASDAISRAKTHRWWWGSESRAGVGWGYPDSGCFQVRSWLPKPSRSSVRGLGPPSNTSWCLACCKHHHRPGTWPAPCHLGTVFCLLRLVQGGQQLVCKQNRRSRN